MDRPLIRTLRELRVPKGLVFLLSAALVLPAGLASGHSLYFKDGQWVHHHTDRYTVCNEIDQDNELGDRVADARKNWSELTNLSLPADGTCHPGGTPVSIQLLDAHFGDTGWRASSADESNPDQNARYHGLHTHVRFNLDAMGSSFGAYKKRALGCRAIGQVIGLATVPANQLSSEGSANDCMSFTSTSQVSQEQNASNYTYTSEPGAHSIEILDAAYTAHEPQVALSGSLPNAVKEAGPLTDSSYSLHVQATDGSATDSTAGVASIEILVDGVRRDYAEAPCTTPGTCAISRSWDYVPAEYDAGSHSVEVAVRDRLGYAVRTELEVTSPIETHAPVSCNATPPQYEPGETPELAGDASSPDICPHPPISEQVEDEEAEAPNAPTRSAKRRCHQIDGGTYMRTYKCGLVKTGISYRTGNRTTVWTNSMDPCRNCGSVATGVFSKVRLNDDRIVFRKDGVGSITAVHDGIVGRTFSLCWNRYKAIDYRAECRREKPH